jgi:D-alanyl-D-alanine carboxypeptidase/Transglycosylase-like domain
VAKLVGSVVSAGVSVLLAIPLFFGGGDTASTAGACVDGSADVAGETDQIAATIRGRESGGDYRARAHGSTASGAYQFTDGTWAGYGGYARAWLAPPEVQDTKAAAHITSILAANNGDVTAVPVVWYIGYLPAPEDPAWDQVPSPGAGNQLTPREYQLAWLEDYGRRTATAPTGTPAPSTCAVPAPRPGSDLSTAPTLVTVEGITVADEIASEVQALVQAARGAGHELTGSGYRSPQRQIELRRQNCGSSDYAIYEMPSSSCSPPTARPGTSNHEQGLAVDFSCNGSLIRSRSSSCFAWLSANALHLGLHNMPSEPWHWSVDGR